jgi:hypothetical protein
VIRSRFSEPISNLGISLLEVLMSKESPQDDPRQRTDDGSHSQTEKPWKGNPEKEQRSGTKKTDPDKWQETNTH